MDLVEEDEKREGRQAGEEEEEEEEEEEGKRMRSVMRLRVRTKRSEGEQKNGNVVRWYATLCRSAKKRGKRDL